MTMLYRQKPKGDAQTSFFVPALSDVSIKDDVNLLDVSPYSLSKNIRYTPIEYTLNGAEITISPNVQSGLATVFDYDIIIHMISYLNEEAKRYRKGLADKPPHSYRPNTYDILKFCHRDIGGRQFKALENSCKRLQGTNVTIVSETGQRRHAKGFGLVDGWDVVSKTPTGNVSTLEIGIPNWIYDGVVLAETPSILTLHDDYFLLKKANARALYRLARKAAGNTTASYSLKNVHYRSGSPQPFKEYTRDIKKVIEEGRIIDYSFELDSSRREKMLNMVYIGETRENPKERNKAKRLPSLKTTTFEKAKSYIGRDDIYAVHREWEEWVFSTGRAVPDNPDGAFINFCKQYKRT